MIENQADYERARAYLIWPRHLVVAARHRALRFVSVTSFLHPPSSAFLLVIVLFTAVLPYFFPYRYRIHSQICLCI